MMEEVEAGRVEAIVIKAAKTTIFAAYDNVTQFSGKTVVAINQLTVDNDTATYTLSLIHILQS